MKYEGWKVTKSPGGYYDWTRPLTEAEREGYLLPDGDSRPMSLLGVAVDESAAIYDDDAAKLVQAAPAMYKALMALLTNKSINLADLTYTVREREGLGWDGPDTIAWSQAVDAALNAVSGL